MDFDFSDDQEMLRDSVRKWVDKAYTFDHRRGIVKQGGFSKESWKDLADLGLLGLQVPEASGGMGFGPVDAMVVMEELGRGIVPARVSGAVDDPSGIALFLVSKGEKGVAVRGYPTQDGACAADITLTGADAIELLAAGPAFAALEHAVDIGIAALCAEAVGAMDKLVAITVEYMNTRKQFGVAIGTFQALRHRMADVKMQLELARSMSFFATLKLDEPAPARRRALAQAKLQLGQSMRFVGQQCIQLHGGIGVTDEYVASHYFKRLTVMEMSYGDTMHQLGEVSARMQNTTGVFA
jgi:alkylation response protein AidB-like acyl-CoA dehydrogenase